MEWNDSLDEISDFEEELRSGADSDPDSELSSSTSDTYDNSDDSDFGAGPSAPNMALGVISRCHGELEETNGNALWRKNYKLKVPLSYLLSQQGHKLIYVIC